ncbi:hypothetical protein GCM10023148_52180 [Actinokineospora soli]
MHAHPVCFRLPKTGHAPHEWEDAAGCGEGAAARFVVVDGATEAFDALRWVAQLVTSFLDAGPEITAADLAGWFESMQRRWTTDAPDRFGSVIEEYKFRTEGSFATFVGGEVVGLDGPRPRWAAAALGDAVLFHVRAGRLLTHFPALSVDDFGLVPDGVDTRPAALPGMLRGLAFGGGELAAGDELFVATDAMAHWLLRRAATDQTALWTVLSGLHHHAAFAELVVDQRAAGAMRDDDVTLLRIRIAAAPPTRLVVCL